MKQRITTKLMGEFMKKAVWLVIFSCFYCSQGKDFVIVLDTSASMSSGQKVILKVKKNIPILINQLKEKDSITLVSFDTVPKIHPTQWISSERSIQKIIHQILSINARGAYTDMQRMLSVTSKTVQKLKAQGRRTYVVIMSDGLDDPPPWRKRNERIRLQWLGGGDNPFSGFRTPYLYYVSLGKLTDQNLEKNLSQYAKNVGFYRNSKTAGLQEIGKDIEEKEQRRLILFILGTISLILFILLIILLVYWFLAHHKLNGVLEFYDKDIDPSFKKSFELSKLNRNSAQFGRRPGSNIKVQGMDLKHNLSLKAYRHKNVLYLKPLKKELSFYQFGKAKKKGLISPGESFRAGGFVFNYRNNLNE